MTLADLAAYKVDRAPGRVRRLPGVHASAAWVRRVSGAVAVQQILGVLETQDIGGAWSPGPEAVHWFAEAGRLAFADRALYLGDPAFVNVPRRGPDRPRLPQGPRRPRHRPTSRWAAPRPGEPPFQKAFLFAPSDGIENGTSHISIVDANGNAVSMTTTIEDGFGARLMTKSGFLLNNELTDFSFAPTEDGKPVANRVEAGKRPRSSMAPTHRVRRLRPALCRRSARPAAARSSATSPRRWSACSTGSSIRSAPSTCRNFGSRNGPTELEAGTEAEALEGARSRPRATRCALIEMTSGIQAIVVTPTGFVGGADSRREGVAIGD